MKVVAVFSLENINNCGDELLGVITERMLQDEGCLVKKYQFMPSKKALLKSSMFFLCLLSKFLYQFAFLFPKEIKYRILNISFVLYLKKYYQKRLVNVDYVICAIGMYKFTTQNFSYVFDILTKIADEQGVPVLINAASIEKASKKDWRFRQLVRVLNRSCVKMITTRDGIDGVEELKKNYVINNSLVFDYVGDPALWIPEYYQIPERKSEVIGIGLIRGEIYKDYGSNFSAQQLMDFYIELINYFENHRKPWVLFCNGMESDFEFGANILDKIGLPKSKLFPRPQNAQEFINMIQSFKVVFAARLHACITSFALDVPFVGLLWDNKLRMFAKTMKITDAFCEIEDLDAEIVSRKLDYAMTRSYDIENRNFYKQRTKKFIHRFLEDNIKE